MPRFASAVVVLVYVITPVVTPAALRAQATAGPAAPSAVIKTYCVSCHIGRTASGRVALDTLDLARPADDLMTWERVVRVLRARTMPPADAPRPESATYESAIAAVTGALDRAAAGTVRPVTDAEIAARLAALLWNGEPDESLRDAAATGALRDTQALQAQVRRMLADPRSSALVSGFFGPWLWLDQLAPLKTDSTLFPEFDDELRAAFRRETDLFIGSQLRDDRKPLELWTANYTFLNERLARHYGVPNVSGPEFRRVIWPGPERAGLLAQGSILTVTARPFASYPLDIPTTSPAFRAKWVLTRFLGVNTPGTLPGVPPMDFPFDKRTPLAKQSRTFPATPCLACHRAFFPLSYGLENFDVLGRWRASYGADPIDASGTMVDGTTFNGPVQLRRALLERQDAFLGALTERLANAVDGIPADVPAPWTRMPAVRAALRDAGGATASWSSLIAAIVMMPAQAP